MEGGLAQAGSAGGRQREQGRPLARDRPPPFSPSLLAAAVELASGSAATFKRTARRFSLCQQDAEDAYQRGLEILMTKAPTDRREELRPWLHTVIKHEALALRHQRERLLAPTGDVPTTAATAPGPEEEAVGRERARQTAEALAHLKPGELQCMLLKALGYSYDEIAARTGFSWTKVNRSLTEGRKRFLERFSQIESGRRCRGLAPLLSAASDGETSAKDARALKEHLRRCQSCRALLRGYRAAPAGLAALIPPAVVLPALQRAGWWSRAFDALGVTAGDRAGALGYKAQQAAELLSAQKAAAVVASTAALAGGAVAGERAVNHHRAGDRPAKAARATIDPVTRSGSSQPPAQEPATSVPLPSTEAHDGRPRERPTERSSDGGEFALEGATPGSGHPASARATTQGNEPAATDREATDAAAAPSNSTAGGFEAARSSGSADGPRTASGGEFGP